MFKCHPIETDVDKFRTISLEGVGKMGTVMLYDFPFSLQQSLSLATFCSPLPKCAIYRLSPVSWNAFLFISSNSEDHAVAVCTRGCALYKFLGGCKSAPRWSRRKTGGSLPLSSRSISASSTQPLTVLPLPWTSLYSSIKWCFLINPSGIFQVQHVNLRQESVFSWYTFKLLPLDISLQEPGTHVACVSHFRVWLEVCPLETSRRLMVWLKLIICVTWASSLTSWV